MQPDASPKTRKLSPFEQAALKVRHQAAVKALGSTPPDDRWLLVVQVVAPSEPVQIASERRARELLERTA